MSYTLEQKLEYARGQAINDQDKEAIQLAIDRIKELETNEDVSTLLPTPAPMDKIRQLEADYEFDMRLKNTYIKQLEAENTDLKLKIDYYEGQSIEVDDEG